MALDHVELPTIDVPDDPRTRAALAELTQLQPSDKYEARDPSGFVVVTVNKARMVVGVRIRPRWNENIPAQVLPEAIYRTYLTAAQRAAAVELAHRPPNRPAATAETTVDLTDLPIEEWVARTSARLNAIEDRFDAIRREAQAPPRADFTEVRSPLGYLTMRLRGGGPLSINGDPHVLARNVSETALSQEALQLFVRAGLGVDSGEPPRPARPRGGGEADDEYFSAVNVFDDRD
ncbi:hypothetical protein [Lentzea flava]|uniref:EspG family protein n=1 Tax=Lentzea flava TaxID=103732 RepID=A0ABQ2V413_9PSEU|nr:hypothetical protein [Lentzea flava]MCP2203252.1 hypothetical protein [Lentzea flava]GGU66774.1 hypothetical protein GCM10010178_68290 [Lentzea flava]